MRTFAEFVMRSRTHALLITVLSVATVLFYWVGAAVVALTVFRHGIKEAFFIWLWAMLPALMVAYNGELAPAMVLSNTLICAHVLRVTTNWSFTLLATVISTCAVALLVMMVQPDWLASVHEQVSVMFSSLNQQIDSGAKGLQVPSKNQILSMISLMTALGMIICLMLGRAMQASLDNPGGFRKEFYALRMPSALASVVLILALGISLIDQGNIGWSYLVALPLFIAGLAYIHQRIAAKTSSNLLFIVLYIFVVFVSPVQFMIAVLGFLDSWMDLRTKFSGSSKN